VRREHGAACPGEVAEHDPPRRRQLIESPLDVDGGLARHGLRLAVGLDLEEIVLTLRFRRLFEEVLESVHADRCQL
jgi:hypothetical protein